MQHGQCLLPHAFTTWAPHRVCPTPSAVDNLFVFILVFSYFKTPVAYQNKVLTYGIATAAFLRLVLIVAGVDIGACPQPPVVMAAACPPRWPATPLQLPACT